jgi:hypothetical protein
VSQNTPECIFHAKMDDLDMFWSNCETMTCADKESNQVGARAATFHRRGNESIATGEDGALCTKRTRDPRETHAGGRHQDMVILCGIQLWHLLVFQHLKGLDLR